MIGAAEAEVLGGIVPGFILTKNLANGLALGAVLESDLGVLAPLFEDLVPLGVLSSVTVSGLVGSGSRLGFSSDLVDSDTGLGFLCFFSSLGVTKLSILSVWPSPGF